MGLFKWFVKLGEYGEFVADGYVYARNSEEAKTKVKTHYINQYHNVVIEDDWDFFTDEDVNEDTYNECQRFDDGVIVRWED